MERRGFLLVVVLAATGASVLAGCARRRCCRGGCPRPPTTDATQDVGVPSPAAPPVAVPTPVPAEATVAPEDSVVPQGEPAELVDARQDLEQLKKLRHPRALNDELLQYITIVSHAYEHLEPSAWGADGAVSERQLSAFRRDAEKAFLRCLASKRVVKGHNTRTDVNLVAARALGDTAPFLAQKERERLSQKIMRIVERDFEKVKGYEVSPDVLRETFEALAKLNVPASVEWMLDEYVHAKQRDVTFLVAAHQALPLFEGVPGKLRHDVVLEFIKTYAGVEHRAAQSSTDPVVQAYGRFWDQVGPGAVAVVQHYAQSPRDEAGEPLATIVDLGAWFRSHKNPRRAPWVEADGQK